MFITVYTIARQWSLSWSRQSQSTNSHLILLRSILTSSSHLRRGVLSSHFRSGFPTKILYPFLISCMVSCGSSVGIALGYGLDDRDYRVRFPAGAGKFSLNHRVENGSGAYTAFYPMGTEGSFHGGKAAGAWSWPLTFIECRGQIMSGAKPPLPNTPSWRGAQLKHRDNFYLSHDNVPPVPFCSIYSPLIMFDKNNKFHFLQPSVTSSLLDRNILSTLFSNTFNIYSSRRVWGAQFHAPTKQQVKLNTNVL
jgi:hypothetical protein